MGREKLEEKKGLLLLLILLSQDQRLIRLSEFSFFFSTFPTSIPND